MNRFWLAFSFALTLSLFAGFTLVNGQEKDKKVEPKDKKQEPKDPNEFGGKSIGEWIKMLREAKNPKHRQAALIVLETTRTAERVGLSAVLEAAEKDPEVQVRVDAVNLLGRLGPKTNGALRMIVFKLQNDESEFVRETAATVLGGDEFLKPVAEYVSFLSERLVKDPHDGTKIAIAAALRNMREGAKPAVPALLEVARKPKEHVLVRTAALHTLSRYAMDNPETLKLLIELTNVPEKDLIVHPEDKKDDAKKRNKLAMREVAIDGLSRADRDHDVVVAALCGKLVDEQIDLRKAAAAALATLGTKAKSGWPTIKTRLDHRREPDSGVRNHMIRLTGTIAKGNPDAVTQLANVVTMDDSTENRLAAIQELGELGKEAQSALPVLTKIAVQDGRATVREAAEKAIAQIKK